ncbi:MAG: DUF6899 family protein [Promethearchaeota archaeon]|jgi:hypothetical protein
MPYIRPEARLSYNQYLEAILSDFALQTEDDLGGHLNYCISFLLARLFEDKRRYVRTNTLRGAVENAMTEFRCQIIPYEEHKRHENGDV